MARKQSIPDAAIIDALKATKGMVYLAAKKLGCHADTIYTRAKTRPKVAEVIKDERGAVVDTAELKLYSAIVRSEPWAVALALKTLGRDRGYGEKPAKVIDGADIDVTTDRAALHDLHVVRRRMLFLQCVESGDWKGALAVLRDEADLLGLYPAKRTEPAGTNGTPLPTLSTLVFAVIQAEQQNVQQAIGGPQDDGRVAEVRGGDSQMP